MKIKPLTIVCADDTAAKNLASEYEYIGRETRRRGNTVTVLTR